METNEEKARQLAIQYCGNFDDNDRFCYDVACEAACMEMAVWKDRQNSNEDAAIDENDVHESIRQELISFIRNWGDLSNTGGPDDYPLYTRNKEQCDRYIAWLETVGK